MTTSEHLDASALAAYIEQEGIDAEIVFLQDETPTVEAAAEAVGVQPPQIVKSLLFVVKEGEDEFRPVLVIANGLARVDYKALADFLEVSRRELRMARPGQVLHFTGYKVGTVPPFGHRQPIPTLLDSGVTEQTAVYAGGGAINALIRLSVAELQRVVDATVVSVSSDR